MNDLVHKIVARFITMCIGVTVIYLILISNDIRDQRTPIGRKMYLRLHAVYQKGNSFFWFPIIRSSWVDYEVGCANINSATCIYQ